MGQFSSLKAPDGDLSIAFVSKRRLCNLHKRYLSDDSPTDVITFPGDPIFSFAGEIVISPAFALTHIQYTPVDFSYEVTLYLLHGYLHLCGFDDQDEASTILMREAENTCLSLLQSHKAIPSFAWHPFADSFPEEPFLPPHPSFPKTEVIKIFR